MSSSLLLRRGLGGDGAAILKRGYFSSADDTPLGAGVYVTDTIYRDALANITISNRDDYMAFVYPHTDGNSWDEDREENLPIKLTGLSSVAGVITVEGDGLPDVGEVVHIEIVHPETLQSIFLPSRILVAP
jgi:hypothetical protein